MKKNDGGPAFPQPQVLTDGAAGIVSSLEMGEGGMSLRDYFAAKALEGLLAMNASPHLSRPESGSNVAYFDHGRADLMAKAAYYLADEMLKARES